MSGAANIVNTLKAKIKETADELEKYEGISEENRAKYNTERKAREEIEAEVLSLNRKIKLMEDNLKRHEDRSASDTVRTFSLICLLQTGVTHRQESDRLGQIVPVRGQEAGHRDSVRDHRGEDRAPGETSGGRQGDRRGE